MPTDISPKIEYLTFRTVNIGCASPSYPFRGFHNELPIGDRRVIIEQNAENTHHPSAQILNASHPFVGRPGLPGIKEVQAVGFILRKRQNDTVRKNHIRIRVSGETQI